MLHKDSIHLISGIFCKIKDRKGAYLVGGAVRDLLLGRKPGDYDIAVTEDAEKFARQLAASMRASFVPLGKPGQIIYRVAAKDGCFDICPLNGLSVEADLKRRDFTVNALGYSLENGSIIDCTGGMRDLGQKRIRMVSEKAFTDDPLRLLRTFRMAAALDFEIGSETLAAVCKHADRIRTSAGERIHAEIMKLFAAPCSHTCLDLMAKNGLLSAVIPEMQSLKGCTQNRFHSFDVLDHTLKTYAFLEKLICGEILPDISRQIPVDSSTIPRIKLSALLHDIGKPATRSTDAGGSVHFYGHDKQGAEIADGILSRLKCSGQEKDFVCFMIRSHLRPLLLFRAEQSGSLSQKAVIRFFMKCGEYTPLLLLHALADDRAKSEIPETGEFESFARNILSQWLGDFQLRKKEPPLITGHDLIREFGLTPSPEFKKILNIVETARLGGNIRTREESLKFAKGCVPRDGSYFPGTPDIRKTKK
ncbi:MAG: CCA tRNA nucleotidyltransferase [Desulfococcaceae bacterium]